MADARKRKKWDEPGSASPASKPRLAEPTPSAHTADDAAGAAAVIAARIAAQYGGSTARADAPKYEKDKPDVNDPDFVKDIDINDERNRYLLTKGPTQAEIQNDTGCGVTTKGQWYPDRTMATERDPPLYLHLTATSKEVLDRGVAKVQELIEQDLGPLTEQRRDRKEPRERVKWPEHKLEIGLENLRNFNVRAKVVGPGGLFVKHIQGETGSKVQIKGLGSGFYETETGAEAPEPMHINITGPDDAQNILAKELAEDLLTVVREKWQEAKAVTEAAQAAYNQPMYMGFGGQPAYPGYGAPPPPSGAAPPPPPPSGEAPPLPPGEGPPGPVAAPVAGGQDYSAYYAQYYAAAAAATPQTAPAAGAAAATPSLASMTPEQQAYYNSPEYKAWYQQYLDTYQQQQQQQQQQPAALPGQDPPPPTEPAPPPLPPS